MTIPTNLLEQHSDNITVDYLFSYWLIAWFIIYYILYYFYINSKFGTILNIFSPIIGMWIAFLYSFAEFLYLLFLNNIVITAKYSFMVLCIKIMPLYLMRNTKILFVQHTLALIFVFLLYNVYLYFNNTNVVEIYTKTENAINSGQIKTPFFQFLDYVYKVSFFS